MERENHTKETSSQTIKSICDILEIFNLPDSAVDKIRKKCWHLADSVPQGHGNGETTKK
jgi:hypothetical protein